MRIQRAIHVEFEHRLEFTSGVLSVENDVLASCFDASTGDARAIAFIDEGVAHAYPGIADKLSDYFRQHAKHLPELVGVETVPGGEVCKNDPRSLNRIVDRIDESRIDRWSTVLCIGGGAVLDVVGFAAATVHRGVRLVRLPTTTLAQADSGIGVKCGVNHRGKKNLLGAFAVPRAVVCDPTFCRTLSDADWRCGFAEAVKVALIKDAELFARMQAVPEAIAARDETASFPVIERSAELHFRHITDGGDPFESGSARPLDMGHWAAHKLEQMTDFAVSHGEAVAMGLAIDLTYAAKTGLMAADEAHAAVDLLHRLGFALTHAALNDTDCLLAGLEEFREHLGGPLTLVMPAGLGATQNVHEVDHSAMRRAIADRAAGV